MKTCKNALSLILLFCLPFMLKAQSDDESIKNAVYNYLDGITKGDTALLNKAFHPTAILRTVNATSGKIQDFPLKTFIGKTPVGGAKASTKLISYSYAGISAQATAELSFDDFKYIDLISLLKVNDEWKIVCRVFSRVDLITQLKGNTPQGNNKSTSSTVGKKTSPAPKSKKDDGW